MKKTILLTKTLTYLLFFFVFTLTANATVGGPTYIGSFKYNNADESIYFTSVSESGRGCPPILYKISLISEITTTVISCEQGEDLIHGQDNTSSNISKLYEEINRITANGKGLIPISLPENNIDVDVTFVRGEKIPGDDYVFRNHFLAHVYQNGKKVDEFPLTGCSIEQPFTFAGYAIPGFEKKIVIVSSAKSDCMEGGYISEGLHIIGGIQLLDKTSVGSWKSERSPLLPDIGTLVVYEKDSPRKIDTTNKDRQSTSTKNVEESTNTFKINPTVLFISALLAGLLVGVLIKRK